MIDADKIVVLGNRGIVVEEGTHEELLKKGGVYADMWDQQMRGNEEGMVDKES